MDRDFGNLKNMEYPGRIIIIGKTLQGHTVIMYAITGRSPSSQARNLLADESKKLIYVRPTDEDVLKTGNPDLLVYPAITFGNGIAVSNGKHTEDIAKNLNQTAHPVTILHKALTNWEYEPDDPNFTPRISGCVSNGAALNVIKRAEDGSAIRNFFEFPLIPGSGKLIATYTGVNENPLPSFSGEPQSVSIPWSTAEESVTALYEELGPEGNAPDFRVAAACVVMDQEGQVSLNIKNRI